jgi:hypothetical protein
MTRSVLSRRRGVLGERVLLPLCLFGRETLLRFVGVADRPCKPFDKLGSEVIALKIGGADPLAERYNLLLPISDISGNHYVRHFRFLFCVRQSIGMDEPQFVKDARRGLERKPLVGYEHRQSPKARSVFGRRRPR